MARICVSAKFLSGFSWSPTLRLVQPLTWCHPRKPGHLDCARRNPEIHGRSAGASHTPCKKPTRTWIGWQPFCVFGHAVGCVSFSTFAQVAECGSVHRAPLSSAFNSDDKKSLVESLSAVTNKEHIDSQGCLPCMRRSFMQQLPHHVPGRH